MILLFAFLLGLLAFGITSRSRRYHKPANVALVAAAYLLPALFLAITLGWAAYREEGFLRFALLGFGFPAEEGGRAIAVGGARDQHEVWISAFDDHEAESAKTRVAADARAERLKLGELRFVPASSPGSESALVLSWDRKLGSVDGSVATAAALLAAGITITRTTPAGGKPRGPYCMMGSCFDCLAVIDGVASRQACMTPVRAGMRVERQDGARDLAAQGDDA